MSPDLGASALPGIKLVISLVHEKEKKLWILTGSTTHIPLALGGF